MGPFFSKSKCTNGVCFQILTYKLYQNHQQILPSLDFYRQRTIIGVCSPVLHSVIFNDSVSRQWMPWSSARICRLIWTFAVRICQKTHFRMSCPTCCLWLVWFAFQERVVVNMYAPRFLLSACIAGIFPVLVSAQASYLDLHKTPDKKYLILVLLNPDMPCLCKQCRSRSVGFLEANWSGSTLFVIKHINLISNLDQVIWLAEN